MWQHTKRSLKVEARRWRATTTQARTAYIPAMPHERRSPRCKMLGVPSEDGAELPYGLTRDVRLAHISEVVAGLKCGCVCPSCRTPLVARKGNVNAHHFGHHADRACAGAWESTLHLLGKEVIAANSSITLPEAVAVLGDTTELESGIAPTGERTASGGAPTPSLGRPYPRFGRLSSQPWSSASGGRSSYSGRVPRSPGGALS